MIALPEKTGALTSADGVKIFYRHYPAESERARMVITHGLGEHSGRYGNVVDRMLPKGISAWVPDHRGHGQSEGKRGHVLNFMQYLSDLKLMIELAREGMTGDHPCSRQSLRSLKSKRIAQASQAPVPSGLAGTGPTVRPASPGWLVATSLRGPATSSCRLAGPSSKSSTSTSRAFTSLLACTCEATSTATTSAAPRRPGRKRRTVRTGRLAHRRVRTVQSRTHPWRNH